MVDDYGDWNVENIKDRQEKLAVFAVETWSLKLD